MICVYVVGAVKRPGAYYLHRGSTVADAITAAQGFSPFADWSHHCGLLRQMSLSVPELHRFKHREDERISLRDGDQLYFGHETY
jgi:protein involved in polysaccharide export with SLBB domain